MQLLKNRVVAVGSAAALLVTLGGVGGAVAANTIGSKDIKNHSIRSVDVQNNTLRSKDVKDGVLGMRDLNDYTQRQITAGGGDGTDGATGPQGPKGDTGATGPQGPKGDKGDAGVNGTDGVSGYSVHNKETLNVAGENHTITVSCPSGVALGGGFSSDNNGAATLNASFPVYDGGSATATGWTVVYDSTVRIGSKAWVLCATVN